MYTVNAALWWLRILSILSVHNRLGPYIMMVGKMVRLCFHLLNYTYLSWQVINMIYIITIVLVVLISFGLVRQSITYPNESWSWMLVRDIFYKPYFMLYGEVYADEIAPCGDRGAF